jgi:hypothetical protein
MSGMVYRGKGEATVARDFGRIYIYLAIYASAMARAEKNSLQRRKRQDQQAWLREAIRVSWEPRRA